MEIKISEFDNGLVVYCDNPTVQKDVQREQISGSTRDEIPFLGPALGW